MKRGATVGGNPDQGRDRRAGTVSSSRQLPREGVLWLVATALLLGVGVYKGINLVALLGSLLLAAWALNAFLAGRGLRRLCGRRRVDGPVFAGTPAAVLLEVANPGRRPLPAVHLEDRGDTHALHWFLPALAAGDAPRCRDEVTLPARGRYAWGEFTASSAYPFGLLRRRVTLAPAAEVLVLPRLGRLHRGRFRHYLRLAGLAREWVRREVRRHLNAHSEFHGLRAFRSGDSPRWIHWRTSARCGELMVREFEDAPTDDLVLVVDPAAPAGPAGSPDLEAVVSLAATVCWEWCRQRGDRLVLAVAGLSPVILDGLSGPEHGLRLLECLALLRQEPPGAAPARGFVSALAGQSLPDAPVLVLGVAPVALGEALRPHLRRPVALVSAAGMADLDFYEGPPAAALAAPGPDPGGQSHAP
jgi:uncharacterized protein (DUF58 family)